MYTTLNSLEEVWYKSVENKYNGETFKKELSKTGSRQKWHMDIARIFFKKNTYLPSLVIVMLS